MIAFGGPAGVAGAAAVELFLAVELFVVELFGVVLFGVVVVEVCADAATESASNNSEVLCI
jgi:hypothetical protein